VRRDMKKILVIIALLGVMNRGFAVGIGDFTVVSKERAGTLEEKHLIKTLEDSKGRQLTTTYREKSMSIHFNEGFTAGEKLKYKEDIIEELIEIGMAVTGSETIFLRTHVKLEGENKKIEVVSDLDNNILIIEG